MTAHPTEAIRSQLMLLHAANDACDWIGPSKSLPGRLSNDGLRALTIGRLQPHAPQLVAASRQTGHTAGHHFAAAAIVNIAAAAVEQHHSESLYRAVQVNRSAATPPAWLCAVALMNASGQYQPPPEARLLMPKVKRSAYRHIDLDFAWRAWVVGGAVGITAPGDVMAMLRYAPETAGLTVMSADSKQEQTILRFLRQMDKHPELPALRQKFIDASAKPDPYPDDQDDHGTPEAYVDYLRGLGLDGIANLISSP